jgi:deoxyguanosine kinase
MYYRVHEALAEKIPMPDLLVYLRATTDTLMQRIALRDRPYERQMERSYIDELNQAYDAFYFDSSGGHRTPVLVIETDEMNFVRSPEDLRWVENRIRQELKAAPYQPKLIGD